MANEIKCQHCSEWSPIESDDCAHCGLFLHEEREQRDEVKRQRAETQQGWDIPVLKVKPEHPWYLKPFLYLIRWAQLTGLAIGGAIAWSAWWAAA